jgi:hypothetical protein
MRRRAEERLTAVSSIVGVRKVPLREHRVVVVLAAAERLQELHQLGWVPVFTLALDVFPGASDFQPFGHRLVVAPTAATLSLSHGSEVQMHTMADTVQRADHQAGSIDHSTYTCRNPSVERLL